MGFLMNYQDTIKSLKINIKRNIGTVILVVEGEEYEFKLLKKIFRDILHYQLLTKKRGQNKFKEYNEFVMKGNENSRVIIINTKNSNIGTIENDNEYRNELYKLMYEKYGLDTKNFPIYFIWDRDSESNKSEIVIKLLKKLTSPYENEEYENGLLLLSYPCCESYTISCFEKEKNIVQEDIKKYLIKNNYDVSRIDRYKIQYAALEMIKKIKRFGINFSLKNISFINIRVFEKEEEYFKKNENYILISFISVILIDLGVITFRD